MKPGLGTIYASTHPPAYLERKQAEGKSRRETILKRQLARTVYVTLTNEPLLTQEQDWPMAGRLRPESA